MRTFKVTIHQVKRKYKKTQNDYKLSILHPQENYCQETDLQVTNMRYDTRSTLSSTLNLIDPFNTQRNQ